MSRTERRKKSNKRPPREPAYRLKRRREREESRNLLEYARSVGIPVGRA